MKSRIALLILSLVFSTVATQAQDYKTAIVGTWKCTEVDDSIAVAKARSMMAEAKNFGDSLAAGFVGVFPEMMKEMCPTTTIVIGANGKMKTSTINAKGADKVESATYKLKGNVMMVTLEGKGSTPVAYTIVSVTDKQMVLRISELMVTMTYAKQ